MLLLKKIYSKLRKPQPVNVATVSLPFSCPICGHSQFSANKVLWPLLIEQWCLNSEEVDYINRQQGMCCLSCNCNLRSMTLAHALQATWRQKGDFVALCRSNQFVRQQVVLEINQAGNLSPYLQRLPHHTLGLYPDVDMQNLSYDSEKFDLIIHSDTLEHVPDPLKALSECWRTLKRGGILAYTVPVVFDRVTRRRDGLPASFHGSSDTNGEDWKVVSEYGHDFYLEPYRAGFQRVAMHSLLFPDSTALICSKL